MIKEYMMNDKTNAAMQDMSGEPEPKPLVDGEEPTAGLLKGRSPHGDAETAPEVTQESVRAELAAQAAPPALPWWISEKFHWAQGSGNGFYLKPFPEYLAYVESKAAKAAEAGFGICYPGGDAEKTQEAEIIKLATGEVTALRTSLTAINDLEGKAFERFLVERCLRSGVYAATTQFELVNWSAREAARGKDVSEQTNYGEKVSRKRSFMITAGALYALIRETLPKADLSEAAFRKMARRVIYDTARLEADKLRNPAESVADKKAGLDAAKLTVEDF
jgi:hypothetical protein